MNPDHFRKRILFASTQAAVPIPPIPASLHARTPGATDFLTFDSNQAALASSEGLTTPLIATP